MAGLIVLGTDLDVVQQVPAVPGDAEEIDPGCRRRGGPRDRSLPSTATGFTGPRASLGFSGGPPGDGSRACGINTVQNHPDRLPIRYPTSDRVLRNTQSG